MSESMTSNTFVGENEVNLEDISVDHILSISSEEVDEIIKQFSIDFPKKVSYLRRSLLFGVLSISLVFLILNAEIDRAGTKVWDKVIDKIKPIAISVARASFVTPLQQNYFLDVLDSFEESGTLDNNFPLFILGDGDQKEAIATSYFNRERELSYLNIFLRNLESEERSTDSQNLEQVNQVWVELVDTFTLTHADFNSELLYSFINNTNKNINADQVENLELFLSFFYQHQSVFLEASRDPELFILYSDVLNNLITFSHGNGIVGGQFGEIINLIELAYEDSEDTFVQSDAANLWIALQKGFHLPIFENIYTGALDQNNFFLAQDFIRFFRSRYGYSVEESEELVLHLFPDIADLNSEQNVIVFEEIKRVSQLKELSSNQIWGAYRFFSLINGDNLQVRDLSEGLLSDDLLLELLEYDDQIIVNLLPLLRYVAHFPEDQQHQELLKTVERLNTLLPYSEAQGISLELVMSLTFDRDVENGNAKLFALLELLKQKTSANENVNISQLEQAVSIPLILDARQASTLEYWSYVPEIDISFVPVTTGIRSSLNNDTNSAELGSTVIAGFPFIEAGDDTFYFSTNSEALLSAGFEQEMLSELNGRKVLFCEDGVYKITTFDQLPYFDSNISVGEYLSLLSDQTLISEVRTVTEFNFFEEQLRLAGGSGDTHLFLVHSLENDQEQTIVSGTYLLTAHFTVGKAYDENFFNTLKQKLGLDQETELLFEVSDFGSHAEQRTDGTTEAYFMNDDFIPRKNYIFSIKN